MKSLVVPTLLAAIVAAAVASFVACGSNGPTGSNTGSNASTAAPAAVDAFAKLLGAYKKNPPSTTLTLAKDEAGNCRADVDSDPVGNLPEKWVFWYVINEDCKLNHGEQYPKIKLVFKPSAKKQYPFKDPDPSSKRQGGLVYVHEKIKKYGADPDNEVDYDLYKYSIYFLNGDGVDPTKPLLDPDLEVEGGSNNIPPARKSPGPAPATAPPAKKQ